MHFSQLDTLEKGCMVGFYIICFSILLITILAHIQLNKNKKSIFPLLIHLVITVILDVVMKEISYYDTLKRQLSEISKLVDKIPIHFFLIYGIFIICYCIYLCYKLNIYIKTSLNLFSVKKALENLPTGIAFATKDGELILSNRVLQKLSHCLTNKDLQNGDEFWNDLTILQNSKECQLQSEQPIFMLPNGEVWQFSKRACLVEQTVYNQIKAENITDMYKLSEDLKKANTKLLQQQKVLQELFTNIEYNVMQQVVLDMRIDFHNQLGNLNTFTKKVLDEGGETSDTNELLDLCKHIFNSLDTYQKPECEQLMELSQIKKFAEKLDCELFIAGELPKEKSIQQIILLAINEMLKNAVYHAKAKRLFVNFKTEDTNEILEIKNVNTHKLSVIKEGGGLSGIRKKVEQSKGDMQISLGEDITLRLSIPKIKEIEHV